MIDVKKFKEINIQINSFAQNLIPIDEVMNWFDLQDDKLKKDILIQIWNFLVNAHPTLEEINEGINKSEQKDTYTAAILLKRFSFKEAQHKIFQLPDNELRKTFKYVISIFKIADTRRRIVECKGQCGHFWHNLDKKEYE